MAFFLKALAAIVTADAIDRHARSRPTRYWYPNQPGLPPPGSQLPSVMANPAPAAPPRQAGPVAWDLEHPERPTRASQRR
jgi:hypothetical protein